jgi:hypothetical protein
MAADHRLAVPHAGPKTPITRGNKVEQGKTRQNKPEPSAQKVRHSPPASRIWHLASSVPHHINPQIIKKWPKSN